MTNIKEQDLLAQKDSQIIFDTLKNFREDILPNFANKIKAVVDKYIYSPFVNKVIKTIEDDIALLTGILFYEEGTKGTGIETIDDAVASIQKSLAALVILEAEGKSIKEIAFEKNPIHNKIKRQFINLGRHIIREKIDLVPEILAPEISVIVEQLIKSESLKDSVIRILSDYYYKVPFYEGKIEKPDDILLKQLDVLATLEERAKSKKYPEFAKSLYAWSKTIYNISQEIKNVYNNYIKKASEKGIEWNEEFSYTEEEYDDEDKEEETKEEKSNFDMIIPDRIKGEDYLRSLISETENEIKDNILGVSGEIMEGRSKTKIGLQRVGGGEGTKLPAKRSKESLLRDTLERISPEKKINKASLFEIVKKYDSRLNEFMSSYENILKNNKNLVEYLRGGVHPFLPDLLPHTKKVIHKFNKSIIIDSDESLEEAERKLFGDKNKEEGGPEKTPQKPKALETTTKRKGGEKFNKVTDEFITGIVNINKDELINQLSVLDPNDEYLNKVINYSLIPLAEAPHFFKYPVVRLLRLRGTMDRFRDLGDKLDSIGDDYLERLETLAKFADSNPHSSISSGVKSIIELIVDPDIYIEKDKPPRSINLLERIRNILSKKQEKEPETEPEDKGESFVDIVRHEIDDLFESLKGGKDIFDQALINSAPVPIVPTFSTIGKIKRTTKKSFSYDEDTVKKVISHLDTVKIRDDVGAYKEEGIKALISAQLLIDYLSSLKDKNTAKAAVRKTDLINRSALSNLKEYTAKERTGSLNDNIRKIGKLFEENFNSYIKNKYTVMTDYTEEIPVSGVSYSFPRGSLVKKVISELIYPSSSSSIENLSFPLYNDDYDKFIEKVVDAAIRVKRGKKKITRWPEIPSKIKDIRLFSKYLENIFDVVKQIIDFVPVEENIDENKLYQKVRGIVVERKFEGGMDKYREEMKKLYGDILKSYDNYIYKKGISVLDTITKADNQAEQLVYGLIVELTNALFTNIDKILLETKEYYEKLHNYSKRVKTAAAKQKEKINENREEIKNALELFVEKINQIPIPKEYTKEISKLFKEKYPHIVSRIKTLKKTGNAEKAIEEMEKFVLHNEIDDEYEPILKSPIVDYGFDTPLFSHLRRHREAPALFDSNDITPDKKYINYLYKLYRKAKKKAEEEGNKELTKVINFIESLLERETNFPA